MSFSEVSLEGTCESHPEKPWRVIQFMPLFSSDKDRFRFWNSRKHIQDSISKASPSVLKLG